MEARKEEDRNEDELVRAVRPLLEQAEKILNETNGLVKGADPDNRLSRQAKRAVADHTSSPEEHRLAEALKVLIEEVNGTIDWAKNKLDAFPKAKNDLGPLLDALGQPLLQIVSGVGLLLAGVLNLVGKLVCYSFQPHPAIADSCGLAERPRISLPVGWDLGGNRSRQTVQGNFQQCRPLVDHFKKAHHMYFVVVDCSHRFQP